MCCIRRTRKKGMLLRQNLFILDLFSIVSRINTPKNNAIFILDVHSMMKAFEKLKHQYIKCRQILNDLIFFLTNIMKLILIKFYFVQHMHAFIHQSIAHSARLLILVRKLCIAYQKKNLYLLLLFIIMSISSKYNKYLKQFKCYIIHY